MLKLKFIISSILLAVFQNATAQTSIYLYGNVSNLSHQGIGKVDVRFLDVKDSSVLGNTVTDSLGNFALNIKLTQKLSFEPTILIM